MRGRHRTEAPGYHKADPAHGPNYGPGWRYGREPDYTTGGGPRPGPGEYSRHGLHSPAGTPNRPLGNPGFAGRGYSHRTDMNERQSLEHRAAVLRNELSSIERRLHQLSRSGR